MPMGKGTYGSKRGRPKGSKQLKQPNMKGRKGPGAASKSRYDKIIYGNTKRKKR